jgi:hypothetical protein
MCTTVIVVSLPGLKSLFVQSRSPGKTSDRSTNSYIHMSSRQLSSNRPFASRARIGEEALDDELELISYGQNSALVTTRTPSETRNRISRELSWLPLGLSQDVPHFNWYFNLTIQSQCQVVGPMEGWMQPRNRALVEKL